MYWESNIDHNGATQEYPKGHFVQAEFELLTKT